MIVDNEHNEVKKPIITDIRSALSKALILCIVSVIILVAFTFLVDIAFDEGSVDFGLHGANAVLLTVCTVVVSLIAISWGKMRGEDTAAHKTAEVRIERNIDDINGNGFAAMTTEYCRAWEEDVYNRRISDILRPFKITTEQFAELRLYRTKDLKEYHEELTKLQIDAIKRAKRVKKPHYNEGYLLTSSHVKGDISSPSNSMTTGQRSAFLIMSRVITAVLMSMLVVSFSVSLITDLSIATLIACAIKIITLVASSITSAYSGYTLIAVDDVQYLIQKSREQEKFLIFCRKKLDEQN